MDYATFKRILTTFADMPANVDVSRGRLMCEIRDEMIEASTHLRDGEVWVTENGEDFSANHWLIKRVAKLPILADRILTYIEEPKHFIGSKAKLFNSLDEAADEENPAVGDAAGLVGEMLGRQPVGSTNVVYLTSDAGEGKTTLIAHLARLQAEKYKRKESHWLLVPITLGGKPFLRFDDLVVGFLSNRLRFPLFYYESFMEMVKLGVLVPAFDGFEEMFVQNPTGEALSAVGNLMRALGGTGTVLIAARKAYFDYQDALTQARVFDTIGAGSVVFSRAALCRWAREQFLAYCEKRGIEGGAELFDEVAKRLENKQHPLLTRAVLVKRLLSVAEEAESLQGLLEQVGNSPSDYFSVFVEAIIVREAHEKWIDASGEPAKPLLSSLEHFELLASIAQEMWMLSTESLKGEVIDMLTELFCEARRLAPNVTFQIKERAKHHALIIPVNGARDVYSFDHEEFKNFFLGVAIGRICTRADDKQKVELLTLLRRGSLPSQTVESALSAILRCDATKRVKIPAFLQSVASLDGPTSFTHENVARLLLRILHGSDAGPITFRSLTFGEDALRGLHLSNVSFVDCSFASTSLQNTMLSKCRFEGCHFERLDLDPSALITETEIIGGDQFCVVSQARRDSVYEPEAFPALLRVVGFTLPDRPLAHTEITTTEKDWGIKLFPRMLRQIGLRTRISEHALVKRLGPQGGAFVKEVVPVLIKAGVLLREWNTVTREDQFRLTMSMERLQRALRRTHKSVEELIAALDSEEAS